MKIAIAIIAASFLSAIVATVAAEGRSNRSGGRMAWVALFALYCVCVGIVSALLEYFLGLRTIVSLVISVPLGVPAFWIAAKMAEV